MASRADVLGALIEAEGAQLREDVYENMVRSAGHVAGIVAGERKARAAAPGASAYESSKHPRGAKGSGRGGQFVAKGSSGTPVNKVQKALKRQQTGSFDEHTKQAVEAFQRANGLKVDGVVGAQTAQALLGNRNARTVTPGALSTADAKALGVTATSRSKSSRSAESKKSPAARRAPAVRTPAAPTRIGGGVVV